MLCISGAIAASGGFTENVKPMYLQGVTCTGSETSLFNCSFATTERTACTQRSDAGVICQGTYKFALHFHIIYAIYSYIPYTWDNRHPYK